jgi:hypothetical protein
MNDALEAMNLKLNGYSEAELFAANEAATRFLISKLKSEVENERNMKESAEQARAVAVSDKIAAEEKKALAIIESENYKFLFRLMSFIVAGLVLAICYKFGFSLRGLIQ